MRAESGWRRHEKDFKLFNKECGYGGRWAGMLVTAVLQSSSATTVMVIGFVSAGLMSLPQAISVIFGAEYRYHHDSPVDGI